MKKCLIVLASLALLLLGMAGSARSEDGKPQAPGQTEKPVKAEAVSLPGGEHGIGFDDIVYAPPIHQVIVPAAQTGRVYLIDPATKSHESCAVWRGRTTSADAGDGYVFAVDRTHSAANVIDPKLHKVVASATLEMEPDIVRYVPATHEVWVTEEHPQRGQVEILAFSDSGKVRLSRAAAVKVAGGGDDPDVLSFDPGLKLPYVSAESGDVWVYRENGKALVAVGNFSMPHAHTVCADAKTHLVYFPLENIDRHPLLRIMEPVATSE